MLNDQLESARTCNKSSNLSLKVRINHGYWSATISTIKGFANTQVRSHANIGEVPNPCDHPASYHVRIGSILTLPKLHLATYKSIHYITKGLRFLSKQGQHQLHFYWKAPEHRTVKWSNVYFSVHFVVEKCQRSSSLWQDLRENWSSRKRLLRIAIYRRERWPGNCNC